MEDKEIIAVERHVSGERKARAFLMRKGLASVMERLTNSQQDAMVEIALAPRFIETPNLKTASYGSVAGMSPEDLSVWKMDVLKRYGEWKKLMFLNSPITLSICQRVCQFEDPIENIRKEERIGYETAVKLLVYGLKEYTIISGWEKNTV